MVPNQYQVINKNHVSSSSRSRLPPSLSSPSFPSINTMDPVKPEGRLSGSGGSGSTGRFPAATNSLREMMLMNPTMVSAEVMDQHEKYLQEYDDYYTDDVPGSLPPRTSSSKASTAAAVAVARSILLTENLTGTTVTRSTRTEPSRSSLGLRHSYHGGSSFNKRSLVSATPDSLVKNNNGGSQSSSGNGLSRTTSSCSLAAEHRRRQGQRQE